MLTNVLRLLALPAIIGAIYALDQSGFFDAAFKGVQRLGPWAMPAFVALHALSVIAFVPSVAPTIAAGALFGVAWGFPVTLAGAGIGALAAFLLGRHAARGWVERRFSHDPRFRALSRLSRERGWKIVAMGRLTPLFPFSFVNYAFGVTAMPASHYLLASMLGTIPSNAVYVYLGAMAGEIATSAGGEAERTALEWALLAGGLIVTVVLALYLRRAATAAFEADRQSAGGAGETPPQKP